MYATPTQGIRESNGGLNNLNHIARNTTLIFGKYTSNNKTNTSWSVWSNRQLTFTRHSKYFHCFTVRARKDRTISSGYGNPESYVRNIGISNDCLYRLVVEVGLE